MYICNALVRLINQFLIYVLYVKYEFDHNNVLLTSTTV